MTNPVLILKIGEYNPIKNGLSKYKSLNLITTYQYDPGIISRQKVFSDLDLKQLSGTKVIIHSNLRRAYETALVIQRIAGTQTKLLETNLLNEVKFSLKELLSQEEYAREGSDLVRQRFIEAFVEDSLSDRRNEIFSRIKGLGKLLCESHTSPSQRMVCVSHSFFMKILQIYLIDNRLFDNPDILAKHFDPFQRTFEFCQGFEFNPEDLF